MKKIKKIISLVLVLAIIICLPVQVMAAKTNKVTMSSDSMKSKQIKLGNNIATSNDERDRWLQYEVEEDGVYKITFSNFREKGKKSKKSDGSATIGIAVYEPDSGQDIISFKEMKWSNGSEYPHVEIRTAGNTSPDRGIKPIYKVSTKIKVNAGTILYIQVIPDMAMGSSHKAQIDINLKKVK